MVMPVQEFRCFIETGRLSGGSPGMEIGQGHAQIAVGEGGANRIGCYVLHIPCINLLE